MRTWEDYKNHVKSISKDEKRNMEEIEEISAIVSSIIGRRQELGMSQRALAERCGIPQWGCQEFCVFRLTNRI